MAVRKYPTGSGMQYNIFNILSTRPLPQSKIDEAKADNINIEVEEFIITEPIHHSHLEQSTKALSAAPLTAVFTSMNAVAAVAAMLENSQPSWQIFALGTATKKIATDKFNNASVDGGGENAMALADRIIAAGNVKSVVFFCG